MKYFKRFLGFFIAFVMCVSLMPDMGTAYAASGAKNMTVMIYMVGSDLESTSGNASVDLLEIAESMADTRHNNIVIYAGGASAWQIDGLSAEKDSILKVSSGNVYVVDTLKAANMGEADTLSSFINYCYDNYSSDSYSLILWDHGGGAVVGFGYDENYEDTLSLDELQTALEKSVGKRGKKLELVGFDACLMSSLEVADVLEPYAKYMVASQETEPGWGWDYSFLSCLTDKPIDGETLAKNIIDYYMEFGEMAFELYPQLYCDLTLSCVDLTKYAAVEEALNVFFSSLEEGLTVKNFPQVSRTCSRLRGFGEFSSNYNYGMLDSVNLIKSLDKVQKADGTQKLLNAIDDMVVYASGNVDDAEGISICYPNKTDDAYRRVYMYISEEVDFAEGYRDFISDLYDMDKNSGGDRAIDLSDVVSNVDRIENSDSSSTYDVKLQLSEEQLNNTSNINAFIICNAKKMGWAKNRDAETDGDTYLILYGGKNVPVDDDGTAHIYYADKALYAKNALTEEVTAAPLVLYEDNVRSDEKRYTMNVVLTRYSYGIKWAMDTAELQVYVNDENPDGLIGSVVPLSDLDTPNKQLLCIDNYDVIGNLSAEYRVTRDEEGKMLPVYKWENTGSASGYEIPCAYFQLVSQPIEKPECFYCMFVLYDNQGNATATELIPLADATNN